MPVYRTPKADAAIPTIDVVPEGLDVEREFFTIPVFTRDSIIKEAREAATKTATNNKTGKAEETFNNDAYFFVLLSKSLKGWSLFDQNNEPIPFNDDEIKQLPWGVRSPVADEILNRGGFVSTAEVVTKSKDGIPFQPQGADESVGAEPLS